MKYLIDLHVHSKYSEDNNADPEETVQYALERGLHGIAFTEHYSYGASEFVEALGDKYSSSILLFRGVEFSADEGHCLVFGFDPDNLIQKHTPVDEIIRVADTMGGVVIPSHPYRPGTSLENQIFDIPGIVALEGCNGVNTPEMNAKAISAARKLGLPYTGGSDAHESENVGLCYTEFDQEVTYENFIDLLKAGKYRGIDIRKPSGTWFSLFE
ncbi:MAG: PHP domain-containing protein [Nitrospirota bacterium]